MPDAKYDDFGTMGEHPAFKLGYEHPDLVDALADLGNSLFEAHADNPRESRYLGGMSTFDADIPTRIFSLNKKENLLDVLVTAALELEVEVSLMATHPESGETETVWESKSYQTQEHPGQPTTLHHFEVDESSLVLDILSRPTCERVRVLLD